jgi:hypothetical protein
VIYGWILLLITTILVLLGCIFWVSDYVGVGQFFLVMASGTAGGSVVIFVEERRKP